MKIQTKILLAQPIVEEGMAILRDNIEEIVVAPDSRPETILSLLDERVEGVIVRFNVFNRAMIEKAPNLRGIARHGIGVELIDLDAATEHGVIVVNTPDAATVSVAEHAVMMMLVLAKKLAIGDSALRAGDYAIKDRYAPRDLEGNVAGIAGLGKIGQEVARRCKAFDMRIMAYDPYLTQEIAQKLGVERVDSLEALLMAAVFVSLHMPQTDETMHMMGEKQFAMMKSGAYLINCARGAIIDEQALIAALESGKIAGAGLDVFEKEPPARDNPLFKMQNVVVTPHSSALTENGKVKMAMGAAMQLVQILRGERPESVVNRAVFDK